jgi:hypothetical protein
MEPPLVVSFAACDRKPTTKKSVCELPQVARSEEEMNSLHK